MSIKSVNKSVPLDKIILEDSLEKKDETRNLDIFQHLKSNINNQNINCTCENTEKFYCIPCKVSVCQNCYLNEHQKHFLIKINDFNFSPQRIEEIFKPLESFLNSNNLISNHESIKNELIKKLNLFIDDINKKFDKFKKEKYNEINSFFEGLKGLSNKLKNELNSVQNNLKSYIDVNKKFLNLDENGISKNNPNKDSNNTMFLLNYDIVNLCNKKSKEIKLTTESLQEDLKNYSDNLDEDFKKIKIYLDNILYSTNLNLNIPKKEESININTISTNKKQNQNIINVKLSKNNSKSNQSTMTLDKNKSKEIFQYLIFNQQ